MDVLDHATSEIAIGSKLGIDATKKIPGEGFKRPWPPLIKMNAVVKAKVNALLGNSSDNPPARGYLVDVNMRQRQPTTSPSQARRWAIRLTARIEQVLAAHPKADRDNVRHTLILLEQPPLERLQRSLIRGRATALRRK